MPSTRLVRYRVIQLSMIPEMTTLTLNSVRSAPASIPSNAPASIPSRMQTYQGRFHASAAYSAAQAPAQY